MDLVKASRAPRGLSKSRSWGEDRRALAEMQDLDIKLVKDQSAGRCKRGYRENQLLFCKSHLVNGS